MRPALTSTCLATLAFVACLPSPARADAPVATAFEIVNVTCPIATDDVQGVLNLSHSSTGAGAPGGDLILWASDADPGTDPPLLSGYTEAIDRDGSTLTGSIELTQGGGGGQGLAPALDDHAVYEVGLLPAGAATTELLRGPIVEDHVRWNQRWRSERERTPVVGDGTLQVPGLAPIVVTCNGEEVVERTVITSPAARTGSGDFPLSLHCVTTDGDDTLVVDLVDHELVVLIGRTDDPEPSAFGVGEASSGRRSLVATIELVTVEGEPAGVAEVDLALAVTRRTTERHTDGGRTTTTRIEQVAVTGTVTHGGSVTDVHDCSGVRGGLHAIERP